MISSALLCLASGLVLRICLFLLPQVSDFLSSRPEISTPATSWSKVVEGLIVFNHTGLFHQGDSYHGSTLMLLVAYQMKKFPQFIENCFFIIFDIVTSIGLYKFSKEFLCQELMLQVKFKNSLSSNINKILLSQHHVNTIPLIVTLLYFLNPFTLFTCIVKSTLTITNMFIVLCLYKTVKGDVVVSTLFLAICSYETFYTCQLIFALSLCIYKYNKNCYSVLTSFAYVILWFCSWLSLLFSIAYLQENNWVSTFKHIHFILTVPDQTPNIGLFWYFFTEIFDHFQIFFLFVFQINAVIFSFPMSFKFKYEPVLFAFVTIGLINIFKSYPSFGDAGLWFSILPLWSHVFKYTRFHVVGSVMGITAVVLCPVMWNLWIYAQSANANFFFAATLTYNLAQIFILADIVRASLEWHIHLKSGLKLKLVDTNEDAKLRLMD